MTSTPGTTQRPIGWAVQGQARGSGFKIKSTVSVRGIPTKPQLETIRRFLANSLLIELKAIHVLAAHARTLNRAHRRSTVTIQVRSTHRLRVMVKELLEWMTISLEEVLVDGGLWEKGIRSPVPADGGLFETDTDLIRAAKKIDDLNGNSKGGGNFGPGSYRKETGGSHGRISDGLARGWFNSAQVKHVRQYRGRRSNVPPRNGSVPPIFSSRIARCTERSTQAWKRFWTNPTRVLFIYQKQMLFGQVLRVSIMWIRRQPSVCR
jgi:hypothetical protein